MHLHRTRLPVVLGSTVLALGLAGCAPHDQEVESASVTEEPSPAESSPTDATPPPSPSASPTTTPTPSESPSPTRTPSAPAGPKRLSDRLLAADEMPTFNARWTWKPGETRTSEGPEPFGKCHEFAMTSIGATRVAVRTFEGKRYPDSPASAGHLVAQFADEMTAKRAWEVLRSWRGSCEEELADHERRSVDPFEPVEVPAGVGGWYLLVYGPVESGTPDDSWFDAQGLTRVGSRISVLQMRGVGQDYNYPAGEEPMVGGVRRAAAALR